VRNRVHLALVPASAAQDPDDRARRVGVQEQALPVRTGRAAVGRAPVAELL